MAAWYVTSFTPPKRPVLLQNWSLPEKVPLKPLMLASMLVTLKAPWLPAAVPNVQA